jgi:lipoprotein-releasing system permease protein
MTFAILMARRYLTSRAVVAIAAVAIAVAVQILVLSVMRGFRADLMDKFIGLNPHLRVLSDAPLPPLNIELIPSVEGEGILTLDRDIETGIKIRGVTPEMLTRMPSLEWSLPQGSDPVSVFSPSPSRGEGRGEGGIPVVTIGSELAAQLGVTPEGRRKVTLIAPFGQVSPSGDLMPQRMTVTVGGIFRSGLYEIDQSLVMMTQADAKRLLGPQATESAWGYVADPMDVATTARALRDQYPELKITTWQEENAALFGALTLERIVMTILLILVVAIAATGIVGVLFLLGLSRQQEVGILLALGCSLAQIRKIFLLYGAMVGAIGSGIGCVVALIASVWISRGGIPLPESLYLHTLPVAVSVPGLMLVTIGAILLTTAAAWYPTRGLKTAVIAQQLKGEEWASVT